MIKDKLRIVSISRQTILAWREYEESTSRSTVGAIGSSRVGVTLVVGAIRVVVKSPLVAEGLTLVETTAIMEALLDGGMQVIEKLVRVAAPLMVAAASGNWGMQDTGGKLGGNWRVEGSAIPKHSPPFGLNSGNMSHSKCSGHLSPEYVNHGRQLFLTSQHKFLHGRRTNTVESYSKHGGA